MWQLPWRVSTMCKKICNNIRSCLRAESSPWTNMTSADILRMGVSNMYTGAAVEEGLDSEFKDGELERKWHQARSKKHSAGSPE